MNQGCPNEGTDHRILGPITCWLERHMSWQTKRAPMSLTVAFPPFIAVNIWLPRGKYLVLRAGFRFDVNWSGYIFPEFAVKVLDHAEIY